VNTRPLLPIFPFSFFFSDGRNHDFRRTPPLLFFARTRNFFLCSRKAGNTVEAFQPFLSLLSSGCAAPCRPFPCLSAPPPFLFLSSSEDMSLFFPARATVGDSKANFSPYLVWTSDTFPFFPFFFMNRLPFFFLFRLCRLFPFPVDERVKDGHVEISMSSPLPRVWPIILFSLSLGFT